MDTCWLYCLIACCLALLTGCQSNSWEYTSSAYRGKTELPSRVANRLLLEADDAKGTEKFDMQLQAVSLLIEDRYLKYAERVLDDMQPLSLPATYRTRHQVAKAQLKLRQGRKAEVKSLLDQVGEINQQPLNTQIDYYKTKSEFEFASLQYLQSAETRIWLDNLLTSPDEIKSNREQLWRTLLKLNADTLTHTVPHNASQLLKGWMSLAAIHQRHQNDVRDLTLHMRRWQQQYPLHPANKQFSKTITTATQQPRYQPREIALLLPLSGNIAASAKAIQNGFFSAHYMNEAGILKPNIRIYNVSNAAKTGQAYQTAVNNGAEFIVGPLTKEAVDNLSQSTQTTVPTLTLNHPSKNKSVSSGNLYHFGLSPEDEVAQVSDFAAYQGHRNAIVIYPNGAWGQRLYKKFHSSWRNNGGSVVDSVAFSRGDDLSTKIKQVLKLKNKPVEKNLLDDDSASTESIEMIPTPRDDVDFIFLAAFPTEAKQIRPLLDFHYAGDIPVYTTSHVYSGIETEPELADLNGITFVDMPWVLQPSQELKKTAKSLWKNDFERYQRLFALGYDAYNLIPHLSTMKAVPTMQFSGLTGKLHADPSGIVHRELVWAKFKNGKPIPLSNAL